MKKYGNIKNKHSLLTFGGKRACCSVLLIAWVIMVFGGRAYAQTAEVSQEEEKNWIYYTLPLPHKITISQKLTVKPSDLYVSVRKGADDIEQNAAAILRDFIRSNTGVNPSGEGVEIIMGVLDQDGKVCGNSLSNAKRLNNFPNNDQAYIIEPIGKNTLVIGALNSKGVFHGMNTIRQLLSKQISPAAVVVPMVWVEDWPDLANRGFWNCSPELYREFSKVKLNYIKNYNSSAMLAFQPPGQTASQPATLMTVYVNKLPKTKALYEDSRLHAVNNIPNMTHVNMWSRANNGLFWKELLRMYPDLAGQGDTAFQFGKEGSGGRGLFHTPCPSHPMFRKIIADTLMLYAEADIMEVSVWTSEYYSYCSCSNCIRKGKGPRQFILEARAIVSAGEDVKIKYPDFKVRVLGLPLGPKKGLKSVPAVLETADAAWGREMPVIMEELPKDVILERVYRHNRSGDNAYAAKGSHKMVDFSVGSTTHEFSRIQGRRSRLQKIHMNKWYGAVAWFLYDHDPVRSIRFASHSIYAMAEWSWNTEGRNFEEYARAWATVTGRKPVDKVVQWAILAAQWDYMHTWDKKSSSAQFIESIAVKMKAGEKLPAKLYRRRRGDVYEKDIIEQNLSEMLELSTRLSDPEFKLRTEHLINLYHQTFALKELVDLYNGEAGLLEIRAAIKSLTRTIDYRSKSFESMMDLYKSVGDNKNIPYVYRRQFNPDFQKQQDIIRKEILPLFDDKFISQGKKKIESEMEHEEFKKP